ncbi:aldehyde dehydrogenase family protein, partial [Weissella cibaria]
RTFVPADRVEAVVEALAKRLGGVTVGNPANEAVRMGPLVSRGQVEEGRARLAELAAAGEVVYGGLNKGFEVVDADPAKGAFFPPTLLYCPRPFEHTAPHDVEAFGPVNTIMPYGDLDEAIALAKRGKGSLVGSLVTADDRV